MTLSLVLTRHWFDETNAGRKYIEYRAMTFHWRRRIWDRQKEITHVCFQRAYTKTKITRKVTAIDVGPCPIDGWDGLFYRIHFSPLT